MEQTAAITFLRSPLTFSSLGMSQRTKLLGVSFNNLVDWHIHIDRGTVSYVFNRCYPPKATKISAISEDDYSALRSEAFEGIASTRPRSNTPSLDHALIETIVHWRRRLSGELGMEIAENSLSALLNTIILLRALEDHHSFVHPVETEKERVLVSLWEEVGDPEELDLPGYFTRVAERLGLQNTAEAFPNVEELEGFAPLSADTFRRLLLDFYSARNTPYEYDFSLMSKHALSRIYEHYVSYLQIPAEEQDLVPLFPRFPEEVRRKGMGTVYTPHFIARFFVRFLREKLSPQKFRDLKAIDPACGSGIFLRALLEEQCDFTRERVTSEYVSEAFSNVVGIDIDKNACQSAELSLSLLHLFLVNELPQSVGIECSDAFEYVETNTELAGAFDLIIANPPFVDLETQSAELRERVRAFMGQLAAARTDLSQAFLLLGAKLAAPNGLLMYVLPRSFLIGKGAQKLRNHLSKEFDVLLLADISSIDVFPGTAAYPILLVLRRRSEEGSVRRPPALVLKCQDFVAQGLSLALDGTLLDGPAFATYEVEQDTFGQSTWQTLPPSEAKLAARMRKLEPLSRFMRVREGAVSGADSVFLVDVKHVPKGEEAIFLPCIRDREMRAYALPQQPSSALLYPYIDGERVSETLLRNEFPKTWKLLLRSREELEKRGPVKKGTLEWWRPERPRIPENLVRPKIVTPHLVLVPRYSLDSAGMYGVLRSPFMYPVDPDPGSELLRFFLAVLNSSACHWHVMRHSKTYSRGYAMLEPNTLKPTPVPDPFSVADGTMLRILGLVDERLGASGEREARAMESEIDAVVADLYGLTLAERRAIGI